MDDQHGDGNTIRLKDDGQTHSVEIYYAALEESAESKIWIDPSTFAGVHGDR